MDILEIMNVPYYKEGNAIHIKKENRGKFTRSAKEHNMGVQEFATHVLNNKDKYSSTLVKRANFAKNSKKFKHAKGGLICKFQNSGTINPRTGEPSIIQFDPDNLNPITGRPSIIIQNDPNIHPEREPLSKKEKETIEQQKQTKAYKYLNTITDFIPVVGTIKEGYRFIENPTFKQGLRTIGSGIADYLGYRILTTPPKIPRPLSMWESSKPKIRRRSTTPDTQIERRLNVEMTMFPVTFDNIIQNLQENKNEKEVNTKTSESR